MPWAPTMPGQWRQGTRHPIHPLPSFSPTPCLPPDFCILRSFQLISPSPPASRLLDLNLLPSVPHPIPTCPRFPRPVEPRQLPHTWPGSPYVSPMVCCDLSLPVAVLCCLADLTYSQAASPDPCQCPSLLRPQPCCVPSSLHTEPSPMVWLLNTYLCYRLPFASVPPGGGRDIPSPVLLSLTDPSTPT